MTFAIQSARSATSDLESLGRTRRDTGLQDVWNPAPSAEHHIPHMVSYVARMGRGASRGFFAPLKEAELFISGPTLRIQNGS